MEKKEKIRSRHVGRDIKRPDFKPPLLAVGAISKFEFRMQEFRIFLTLFVEFSMESDAGIRQGLEMPLPQVQQGFVAAISAFELTDGLS